MSQAAIIISSGDKSLSPTPVVHYSQYTAAGLENLPPERIYSGQAGPHCRSLCVCNSVFVVLNAGLRNRYPSASTLLPSSRSLPSSPPAPPPFLALFTEHNECYVR